MSNGSGVSRGDRNRNARLARLRGLVPLEHAIVGIDLADDKQMVVVCHLGARREELINANVAQVQQIRDLLECVWPAALEAAAQPFRSQTWAAAVWVVLDCDGGDLDRTRRLGWDRFDRAVRREITKRGGRKPCLRIARNLYTPLADPAGVLAHRPGALERVGWVLADWEADKRRLAETEDRMVAVLDELKLTDLATSIPGISAVGAAAILAETGDPHRFPTARTLVKHAGLAPREKLSGTFVGRTRLTGKADPDSASPLGAQHGGRCRPTPSTPTGTDTSPPGRPTSSKPPRPRP